MFWLVSFYCLLIAVACGLPAMPIREQVVFSNVSRFPYVHMTMIERINNTRWLFAFQASHVGEGHPDQRICLQTSDDGGKTWSDAKDLIVGDNVPVWGPVLFHNDALGKTFLYFTLSVPENVRPPDRHFPGGSIYVTSSADGGNTWTEKQLVLPYVSQSRGNVSKMTANKPTYLNQKHTQWALPFWQEVHADNKNDTGPLCAGVLVTTDGGKSHTPFGFIENKLSWLIENTIVPLSSIPLQEGFRTQGFHLVQYFRTKLLLLYESHSYDGGATWGVATPTPQLLQNPDSKIAADVRIAAKGAPVQVLLSLNPNDLLGRKLLSVTSSATPGPWGNQSLSFGSMTTVAETNATNPSWSWSYPTVLAVPDTTNMWAVTFSAFGTQGAMLAWVQSPSP